MTITKKTKQRNFRLHVDHLKNAPNNSVKINDQITHGIRKTNKRFRIKKFDFMKEIVAVAEKVYVRTSKNIKYSHHELLSCLIHFTSTHVSWSRYNGTPEIQISGKYLNSIHLKYIEKGVYKAINERLLEIYLHNNRCAKLKHQSIDSSFIPNKRGIIKPKCKKEHREYDNVSEMIKNNRYNGRKKYIKISHLTCSSGVVLASHIFPGNESDLTSVEQTFDKLPINLNTKKYSKNNKYKQYFLADPGYDSKRIRNFVTERGYTPIIKPNNRNTINEEKKRKLTPKQWKLYKKRFIVESSFAWTKDYPIVNQMYEKTVSSYNGLFQLVNSIILSKKIIKDHASIRNKK